MKVISFLSFDVEALPGRADNNHVDKLIWGKVGENEYGIRKLCGILNEYNVKGNFLIDLSGSIIYGDQSMREIGEYILSQGHELHVHLHSEWLVRPWGIRGQFNGPPGMNQLDQNINTHFLKWSFFKFKQLFNFDPEVFRCGSFCFNEHTIRAAKEAGYKCLTNFSIDRHNKYFISDGPAARNEPFVWQNGLIELPVDFSPEPLTFDIERYFGWFARSMIRKDICTFNLVMHSWSLLKKEGDFFNTPEPAHEERLRYIIEHLKENTKILGYSEYLSSAVLTNGAITPALSEIANLEMQELVACPICSAIFKKPNTDVCPGCESRARHRQIFDAIGKVGNPFDGRRVLANFANSVEKQTILRNASKVLNFDVRPVDGVDIQMDIQNMISIESNSYDGFLAIHVLNHVKDDALALKEIFRILTPGGVALLTIPYRADEGTSTLTNLTEHYGVQGLEKYGVGSYRRYGLQDALELFESLFEVNVIDGFDPISSQSMNVFFLTKGKRRDGAREYGAH